MFLPDIIVTAARHGTLLKACAVRGSKCSQREPHRMLSQVCPHQISDGLSMLQAVTAPSTDTGRGALWRLCLRGCRAGWGHRQGPLHSTGRSGAAQVDRRHSRPLRSRGHPWAAQRAAPGGGGRSSHLRSRGLTSRGQPHRQRGRGGTAQRRLCHRGRRRGGQQHRRLRSRGQTGKTRWGLCRRWHRRGSRQWRRLSPTGCRGGWEGLRHRHSMCRRG